MLNAKGTIFKKINISFIIHNCLDKYNLILLFLKYLILLFLKCSSHLLLYNVYLAFFISNTKSFFSICKLRFLLLHNGNVFVFKIDFWLSLFIV